MDYQAEVGAGIVGEFTHMQLASSDLLINYCDMMLYNHKVRLYIYPFPKSTRGSVLH